MDEVSVPISWVRTHQESGEPLAMDPIYMREGDPNANGGSGNGSSLQENKSPATVAVYLLQLYPVTQACMTQPCVGGTPVTLTAPMMSQVPLQITTTSASNAAFIASPQPVQEDCKTVEPHSVKLEPLCIVTEQPAEAEVKTEPYDPSTASATAHCALDWKPQWKEEEDPHRHATSPPCHYHNGNAMAEEFLQHTNRSQTQPTQPQVSQLSPQAFAGTVPNSITNGITNSITNGISNGISNGITNGISNGITNGTAERLRSEVTGHTLITTAKFQSSADAAAVSRNPAHQAQQHHHQHHQQQQQQHHHHQLPVQVGDKPYSCNVCGKSFARAHNLKSHSQTHSGELPFSCKICRKSYSQEAYFRIHSELLNGGRPYACDICRKLFCNSRSFNFHVRSHSRRKYNVRCAACGEDFTSCKEYESHAAIRHNHQTTVQPSQRSQAPAIPVGLHLQEKAVL